MQRSPALSPQCFFLPQSCRRSPLAVVLSPQSCRRSALAANLFSPQCSRHSPQCSRRSALVAVLSEPQSCRRSPLAAGAGFEAQAGRSWSSSCSARTSPSCARCRAAAAVAAAAATSLTRHICRVSETVRVHGEQHPHHRSLDRSTFARMVTCALHMDHSVACSAACGSPR